MKAKVYQSWLGAIGTAVALFVGNAGGQTNEAAIEKSAVRSFFEQDYLFGTWGGLRTDLSKHGVDFEFLYAGSLPVNLDGGIKRGSAYQSAFLMMMDLDSEKLVGYQGGHFHISSIWLQGEKPFSDKYVGDLNKVNLLDLENSLRLWELYYQQKFLDGKVSVKVGQLDIASDFIVPEYYNSMGGISFLNQTFMFPTMAFNVYDQPYYPAGHHSLASTPYGALGTLVRVELGSRAYVQAGVYDGNPDHSSSGTDIHLDSNEGALCYFELGYKHNQLKEDTGLPGNLKLGAWYHTDDFYDMYEGTFVAFDNAAVAAGGSPLGLVTDPDTHTGNYGLYFLADHYLWLEQGKADPAGQGLVGFARAAIAPQDRNLAQLGLDGGLVYKGLIPTRDWDSLGVAFSYLQISDDLKQSQDDIRATLEGLSPGLGAIVPHADYEAVLEMNYKIQLAAWCAIDTSVQRVFHPGGRISANTPDAWVLSVQTTLRF